jgi:hypothetical protein
MRKDTKAYKNLIDKLNTIFDKRDPISLGAPSGEYTSEVEEIAVHLIHTQNSEEVLDTLYDILLTQFGDGTIQEKETYRKLAEEIYDLKQRDFPEFLLK